MLNSPDAAAPFYSKARQLAAPLTEGEDDHRLRAWWLYVILNSPDPLLERLTLFWHNHFATSHAKVQNVAYMYQQNELFREHALGSFSKMLHAISEDPAMLLWLDGVSNKKRMPNENYARELMELFSLGIGNYTETDIRQAARAFTGWGIRNDRYHFSAVEHDTGIKQVFGNQGNFGGHDIVDMCLEKPACARFMVRKLFRYFLSDTLQPGDSLLEPLAEKFRKSGYQIKPVVSTMLRSNLFYSAECYRAKIKSPVEFAVSLVHQLEGRADSLQLAEMLDPLGQRLFAPPSVKGWEGGTDWLNSNTLLLRHNLGLAITSTEDRRFYNRCDPARLVRQHLPGKDDLATATSFLTKLLLQGDIPMGTRQKLEERQVQLASQKYPAYWNRDFIHDAQIRSLCHLMLTLPEYQLA
ncbi:MAG TPA: DUF1800 domain-containing protein [Gemmatales bacterium]|nr:DUF1800 domain-containing protein [Gemmatales bacterium]